MKQNLLKRVALVALCTCLMGVFVSLTPAKAAHAAPVKAASSCSSETITPSDDGFMWAQDYEDSPIMEATSCAGTQFALIYQLDGNLVLYAHYVSPSNKGRAIWATGTNGGIDPPTVTPAYVVFQGNGNFVLYNAIYFFTISYQADWSSGTANQGATSLRLQADGNLVIYKNNNYLPSSALWSTGTCCWA